MKSQLPALEAGRASQINPVAIDHVLSKEKVPCDEAHLKDTLKG